MLGLFGSREGAKKKEGAKKIANIEDVVSVAIDCGFHLHKELGPGVLEFVYEAVLAEPQTRGCSSSAKSRSQLSLMVSRSLKAFGLIS